MQEITQEQALLVSGGLQCVCSSDRYLDLTSKHRGLFVDTVSKCKNWCCDYKRSAMYCTLEYHNPGSTECNPCQSSIYKRRRSATGRRPSTSMLHERVNSLASPY